MKKIVRLRLIMVCAWHFLREKNIIRAGRREKICGGCSWTEKHAI